MFTRFIIVSNICRVIFDFSEMVVIVDLIAIGVIYSKLPLVLVVVLVASVDMLLTA